MPQSSPLYVGLAAPPASLAAAHGAKHHDAEVSPLAASAEEGIPYNFTPNRATYCGIDLHAQSMWVCILDRAGEVRLHQDMKARPEAFLQAMAPYRADIAVAVECIFTLDLAR